MATIPSSLLDDLNDLHSDVEEDDDYAADYAAANHSGQKRKRAEGSGAVASGVTANDLDELSDEEDEDSEEDSDGDARMPLPEETRDDELDAQLQRLKGRAGFRSVAKLRDTRKFQDHVAAVDTALAGRPAEVVGTLEEWPEYRLIVSSNHVIAAIDEELLALHRYIAELYGKKFPELETIVPSVTDYIRVVRAIGNETDMTLVDLASILPSATVMVVSVTGSATAGKSLSPAELEDLVAACDEFAALEEAKAKILRFVESRMSTIAPNVSALLGTRVAAQLVAIAGGLTALSNIPACNVQLLGQKKKSLAGFSRVATTPHVGVLNECDAVQAAPPDLRRKSVKVLAAKVVLAARVDSFRQATGGEIGRAFRAQVDGKIAKWQEPPPGKQKKPLPAPDDRPSRRRGGKRFRKLKEKMGLTDVRKEANRVGFGQADADYSESVMGLETGRLGQAGSGKLRIERKQQRILKKKKLVGIHAGSSGATGGFASSLAFTPSQGIELINPVRPRPAPGENSGYFSTIGTASAIKKPFS